jgi:hypothetical protein
VSVRAIETVYRGARFRSRLEARWAVFLDAINWTWRYEAEGFELGAAGRYLPDFHLPVMDTWVEVKPPLPRDPEAHWDAYNVWEKSPAAHKAEAFGADHRLIIIHGDPWPGSYFAQLYQHTYWDGFLEWIECPRCWTINIQHWDRPCCNCLYHPMEPPAGPSQRIRAAFAQARSARFEAGAR